MTSIPETNLMRSDKHILISKKETSKNDSDFIKN